MLAFDSTGSDKAKADLARLRLRMEENRLWRELALLPGDAKQEDRDALKRQINKVTNESRK